MELLKRALALIVGLAIAAGVAESFIRVVAIVRYDVKYLATADVNKIPTEHASSFEDFLGEFKVHLVPHRIWQNYFANSLGFTDREFPIEKPKGTMRIMGLGDSFLYGMVAYPQNVLTLVGASLRAECPGESFETMNFGIPATGVWEYRLMHKFAAPIYKPGMVVTHFYMGMTGPTWFSKLRREACAAVSRASSRPRMRGIICSTPSRCSGQPPAPRPRRPAGRRRLTVASA